MAIAESLSRASAPALQMRSVPAAVGAARVYFLMLAVLGLAALALGIENRLTPDLFPVAPPVDFLPPLSAQAWYRAFLLHQQDPVFATCGGAESLNQFRLLYWWEWLRRGSFAFFAAAFAAGMFVAAVLPEFRFALTRHLCLVLIGLGYLATLRLLDVGLADVPDLSRYNTGQYRHAIDMTFASFALALMMASVLVPPVLAPPGLPVSRRRSRGTLSFLLIALIVLDICAGALFASRDAATVWRSFPGYEGALLPPLDRLASYVPMWLNFGFNQYMIQLVHRVLSMSLIVALCGYVVSAALRHQLRVKAAGLLVALLLVLMIAEIAVGAATLNLGGARAPWFVAAALAHEVGAIMLLAVALATIGLQASAPPRREGA